MKTMVDDDKASSDICFLPDINEDYSTPFNGIEFDSTIYDLLNLKGSRDSPNLFQEHNPFLESVDIPKEKEQNPHFSVETESPKMYIAPRVMIKHQDSITDSIELPSSPGAIQDLGLSPRLRVLGSPKPSRSPRFGSPMSSVFIDTAAPFESVKEAVSKFGGITDWKAHKIQTIEIRKTVDQELEKIQENIHEYKKQAVIAEEAKQQVVMELESTKSVIEELKLDLEKAKTEERQAKQDSDLVKLRVEEMEQGTVKSQLEVAKERHMSAISELGTVREEIEMVSKKAKDSVLEAKEANLEAEEKELKMVEDEIARLRQEIQEAYDVKTKLETASTLQQDLRAEIAAYKDSNDNMLMGKRSNNDIQLAVDSARKELEEVKSNTEKAMCEVKTLKIIVGSLQSELEIEKKDLSETKQRESVSVQRNKEEAKDERCTEIVKKLQEASREAEEAKSLALAAQEELRKAKEESDQAKTGVSVIESKFNEAKKEIETAKASEKLAFEAIKDLQETECAKRIEDISNSTRSIIISMEEYYKLSKQAHEVEEAANRNVEKIVSQIELAKEEESRILEKLEEVNLETYFRKQELKEAMEKAEKARDGKLGMEHGLRKWSSENGTSIARSSPEGRNQKNYELGKSRSTLDKPRSFAFDEQGSNSNVTSEAKKKKKRFFVLPKVFMFFSRKRSNK